jgi:hypothetical protein
MDAKKSAAVSGAGVAGFVAGTVVAGPGAGMGAAAFAGTATSKYVDNRRSKSEDGKRA